MVQPNTQEESDERAHRAALSRAEAWIFDLDNTLYPASTNMFEQIDKRMCAYLAQYLDLAPAQAYGLQKSYFREHGTTLRGMMVHHDMDPGPYLDYVHQVDMEAIAPAPRLDAALARLGGRKLVFTNASADHAHRVLARLGIARHFDGIFDIVAADYLPKPDPRVYAKLVSDHSLVPRHTVLVEDVIRNLGPARALGMTTVWVETHTPWAVADRENQRPDFIVGDLADWLMEVAGG